VRGVTASEGVMEGGGWEREREKDGGGWGARVERVAGDGCCGVFVCANSGRDERAAEGGVECGYNPCQKVSERRGFRGPGHLVSGADWIPGTASTPVSLSHQSDEA